MTTSLKVRSKSGMLSAWHTAPRANHRGTLLCLHGGPGGDHHGNNAIFDELRVACVPLGYNVLQFDLFGAGSSDGTPADITLETQVDDYLAVLDFVRHELPGPVHVVGESMGATIAALAWQSDVSSHILLWPAFDLRDTDLRPYLGDRWTGVLEEQGFLDDNGTIIGRTFVEQIRGANFSRCFRLPAAPSLLIHGKGDTAVPFEQSLTAIRNAVGPSVLFAHPTGDHGLQRPEERVFTRDAVVWWLSR